MHINPKKINDIKTITLIIITSLIVGFLLEANRSHGIRYITHKLIVNHQYLYRQK